MAEVEATLKAMQVDKSPGPNGITVEVLVACWDFIASNILAMI